MFGFSVTFVGYELERDAFDEYFSLGIGHRELIKSFLRDVELETSTPASLVVYDDSQGEHHKFICCFTDLSERSYSSEEMDAIPVPSNFSRLLGKVKTTGKLERKSIPKATMVYSYDADGKSRVDLSAATRNFSASFFGPGA